VHALSAPPRAIGPAPETAGATDGPIGS
jgi:hypothetical protein